jgi:hypothetical protein
VGPKGRGRDNTNASQPTLPHKDEHGRVVSLAEFEVVGLLGVLVGLILLAIVDGVLALIGVSRFGQASGWLALILPALLFFDEVRAWRPYGVRLLVGLVAAAVGIALGLLAAAAMAGLPPILSGAVGATVAVAVYAFAWFAGIRWLTGYQSGKGSG